MKINNRAVNPLSIKMPRAESIPGKLIAEFKSFRDQMDTQLASIKPPVFAFAVKTGDKQHSDSL